MYCVTPIYIQIKSVGREEYLVDIDLGTDPAHPPAFRVGAPPSNDS